MTLNLTRVFSISMLFQKFAIKSSASPHLIGWQNKIEKIIFHIQLECKFNLLRLKQQQREPTSVCAAHFFVA